ncbi:MAG: DUF6677 family protein [Phycisphaerales bacterium JB050]
MRRADETFQPIAALMTLIVPGSGYLWFREKARAVYAFIGIMGLLLGGLLIGGLDVIDSRESKYWFYVQSLNPTIVLSLNYAHQNFYKGYELRSGMTSENFYRKPESGERLKMDPVLGKRVIVNDPDAGTPSPRQSIGRVWEVGSLYVALAGMLNLIVLLDVGWHSPRPPAGTAAKGGRS